MFPIACPKVFRLCDRISVLRDGKYVGTLDRGIAADQDSVVRMMIEAEYRGVFPASSESAAGES